MGLITLSLVNEWLSKKNFLKVSSDAALLIILFIVFYAWITFTLIYTPSSHYAYEKVFKSLTNFIFILIILKGSFNTSRFLKISYILIIILLAWFLPLRFLYLSGQSPKGYLFTREVMGLYLHLSMPLGMFLLFYLCSQFKFSNSRLLNSIFYGIGLTGVLLLGARGPILFFVLVYALFFIINKKIKLTIRKKSLALSILAALSLLILIVTFKDEFSMLFELTVRRFSLFFSGLGSSERDFGNSVDERLDFISKAIGFIFASLSNFLFGTGIGSFGILAIGEDIRLYPHNFILEIWCELGLVGVSLFLFIVFVSLRKIRISYYDLNIFPVLYILLNFLKSGILSDMRLLFTILAIYFIAKKRPVRR
jgi:O-antigen ligase